MYLQANQQLHALEAKLREDVRFVCDGDDHAMGEDESASDEESSSPRVTQSEIHFGAAKLNALQPFAAQLMSIADNNFNFCMSEQLRDSGDMSSLIGPQSDSVCSSQVCSPPSYKK